MQIFAVLGWRGYRVSVATSLVVWNLKCKNHSGLPGFDYIVKPLRCFERHIVAPLVPWILVNGTCCCRWHLPPPSLGVGSTASGWMMRAVSRVNFGTGRSPAWAETRCPEGAAVPLLPGTQPGAPLPVSSSEQCVPGQELCCSVFAVHCVRACLVFVMLLAFIGSEWLESW